MENRNENDNRHGKKVEGPEENSAGKDSSDRKAHAEDKDRGCGEHGEDGGIRGNTGDGNGGGNGGGSGGSDGGSSRKTWMWILTVLPLPVVAAAMWILPDKVPMHYDLEGNIDRWGSKYESFLYPATILISTVFWEVLSRGFRRTARKAETEKERIAAEANGRFLEYLAIGMALFYSVMCYASLYGSYVEARSHADKAAVDTLAVITFAAGVFLMFAGNRLPKCRRNSMIGLRTKWSMESERAWALSQRYGGNLFLATGLLLCLSVFYVEGICSVVLLLGVLAADTAAAVLLSYAAGRRAAKEKEREFP